MGMTNLTELFAFSLIALCGALACIGCSRHPDLPSYGSVPAFALTDQAGAQFSSPAVLNGHVWVADFFFTSCPGPCPRMSSQMHQVQTALLKDGVRLVSLTVDPDHDTPPVLESYARRYGARDDVWYVLTASRESLQHLDRDIFQLGDVDRSLQHST